MTGLLPAVLAAAAVAVLLGRPTGPSRLRSTLPPGPGDVTGRAAVRVGSAYGLAPGPAADARPTDDCAGGRTARHLRDRARVRTRGRSRHRAGGDTRDGTTRDGTTREGTRDAASSGPALLACLLAGGAALLVVGGPAGLLLAVLLVAAGPAALARLEPRQARERRERLARDLPLALDLVAACLTGGAGLPAALRVVAEATPGPCGDVLSEVAAALDVGTAPEQAWSVLAGPDAHGLAGAASRALARAGEGGVPVATAVTVLAAQARTRSAADGQRAAARAGVLAVGPLGLCFLPAFVLLGVVPVVAGLVGPLFRTL